MKKRPIKVIKADAEPAPLPPPVQKDKVDGDREMASAVKGWITERRENSRTEAIDSRDSRIAWHGKKSKRRA